MATLCPLCETGSLKEIHVDEVLMYQGEDLHVAGIAMSQCDACGEQLAQPHQIRANERVFADAKRTRDGLLRSQEIVDLRSSLGLTQQQASLMFGGGPNAFSKYERGEVLQSRPMDLLLRTAGKLDVAADFLAMRAGIDLSNKEWETQTEAVDQRLARIESGSTTVSVRRFVRTVACANDVVWRDDPAEATRGA